MRTVPSAIFILIGLERLERANGEDAAIVVTFLGHRERAAHAVVHDAGQGAKLELLPRDGVLEREVEQRRITIGDDAVSVVVEATQPVREVLRAEREIMRAVLGRDLGQLIEQRDRALDLFVSDLVCTPTREQRIEEDREAATTLGITQVGLQQAEEGLFDRERVLLGLADIVQ